MRERPSAVLKLCQVCLPKYNNFNPVLTMRRLSLNQILLFCRQTGTQQVGRHTGYELCTSPRAVDQPRTEMSDSEPSLWITNLAPQPPGSGNNSEEGAGRTQELGYLQHVTASEADDTLPALHHNDPPHANPSPRLGLALRAHFLGLPFAFALYF